MTSKYDILKNTILNSTLDNQSKQDYINKLNQSISENDISIVRNIISTPIINTTIANLGFNPTSIMRDTYKPGFSFKSSSNTSSNSLSNTKPVTDNNIKNAVIVTKEQETGIDNNGNPEIIKSSIQIVKKSNKFNKLNNKDVAISQNQPFQFSDETQLLNEKLIDDNTIPFSKKLK